LQRDIYVVVSQLLLATLAAFGVFALFYIVALIFSIICYHRFGYCESLHISKLCELI